MVSPAGFGKVLRRQEITDELRVAIFVNERTTAFLTFSSQMRPAPHQFRIFEAAQWIDP
jgi:hypothetical protein